MQFLSPIEGILAMFCLYLMAEVLRVLISSTALTTAQFPLSRRSLLGLIMLALVADMGFYLTAILNPPKVNLASLSAYRQFLALAWMLQLMIFFRLLRWMRQQYITPYV